MLLSLQCWLELQIYCMRNNIVSQFLLLNASIIGFRLPDVMNELLNFEIITIRGIRFLIEVQRIFDTLKNRIKKFLLRDDCEM